MSNSVTNDTQIVALEAASNAIVDTTSKAVETKSLTEMFSSAFRTIGANFMNNRVTKNTQNVALESASNAIVDTTSKAVETKSFPEMFSSAFRTISANVKNNRVTNAISENAGNLKELATNNKVSNFIVDKYNNSTNTQKIGALAAVVATVAVGFGIVRYARSGEKTPAVEEKKAPAAEQKKAPVAEQKKAPVAEQKKAPVAEQKKEPAVVEKKAPAAEQKKASATAEIKGDNNASNGANSANTQESKAQQRAALVSPAHAAKKKRNAAIAKLQ